MEIPNTIQIGSTTYDTSNMTEKEYVKFMVEKIMYIMGTKESPCFINRFSDLLEQALNMATYNDKQPNNCVYRYNLYEFEDSLQKDNPFYRYNSSPSIGNPMSQKEYDKLVSQGEDF